MRFSTRKMSANIIYYATGLLLYVPDPAVQRPYCPLLQPLLLNMKAAVPPSCSCAPIASGKCRAEIGILTRLVK